MAEGYEDIRYPVGVQTFSELMEGGYKYVDKTRYIHELIKMGKYYFLSRPRRFGKSLLLSTIEAYYLGKRELFKGLALDSLTDDWEPHPVLHLDLNSREYNQPDSLKKELGKHLDGWEAIYGAEKSDKDVEERFSYVIENAYRKTGKKVVILVDEYDKPLLNAINDEKLADAYRSTLKAFYGNLKSSDRYIEFAMLTGVARFSKVSIFSDLNNLRDISFENHFSPICGISAKELDTDLTEGIKKLSVMNGLTIGETRRKLREEYDGYRFSRKSEDIYNPFSLMNVFSSGEFDRYWSHSGTPTYLVRLLESQAVELRNLSGYEIGRNTLVSGGIMTGEPIAALYQSGYLSIKDYDEEWDMFTLDYPNREVKEGFLYFLVPYYTAITKDESEFVIKRFTKEVMDGKAREFMERLASLVARIPYGGKGTAPEDHFQNAIYLLFTLMGFRTRVEDRTSNGRIDLTVETGNYVYIFEFKVGGSARDAMDQIMERGYWKGYTAGGKRVILVAANFNPIKRELDEFLIEER